jgi:hypothetical protein
MTVDELENEALKLESRERARLAEKLLSSLETLSPAEAERLWAEKALRRSEELEQVRPRRGPPVRCYATPVSGLERQQSAMSYGCGEDRTARQTTRHSPTSRINTSRSRPDSW